VNEQVEYLRLHGDEFAATAEFTAAGVENMVIEAEFHALSHLFSRNNQVRLKQRAKSFGHKSCILQKP
jgi:hypothetical protein